MDEPRKPTRRFAHGTTVDVETSRVEIERLVKRHGADSFASAWEQDTAQQGRFVVIFGMRRRRFRFVVTAPDPKEFVTPRKWEAENRRRWRALVLILKAKLELIESGDADLDSEFLAYLVLPGNETVAQKLVPQIGKLVTGGVLPPLLPEGS